MSGLGRAGDAVRRFGLQLVPVARRDWIEAVWAEAPEVPRGWRRLAWRAGGVQLIAREALMLRRSGTPLLFAVAAAVAAWAAWPGPPAYLAVSNQRALVIAMIAVLALLPLLTRPWFGPAGRSRTARALRVFTYAAILAFMPARNIIEGFRDVAPHAGLDLRVYVFINDEHRIARAESWDGIAFVAIMVLCAAAMLWLTSQRSRVAPVTLAVGAVAGIVVGVAVYAMAPLGLSKAATNPWLPGSDVDPLVLLAWILVFFAPVTAGLVARRCYPASDSAGPPASAVARQILAAGLLTNLVGALLVAAAGTGTTALTLNAAWLRNWLYHGQREFFGIAGMRSLLDGDLAAITYGHELTASVDSSMFLVMCLAFPLIALAVAGMAALGALGTAEAEQGGDPPRGNGGPPGPKSAVISQALGVMSQERRTAAGA
ncbi:MAG TPA: hypothetical protein VME44_06100 [Streptosporangiaceae bacterium]|nr:hypothetical protein [Streptosporangiaceae bacterium]